MDYSSILQSFVFKYFFREVLKKIEKRGPYAGEGIFIAFYSKYPGVRLPQFIKPDSEGKVGIILQHEFYNLTVYSDDFEVNLRFNSEIFRVSVPYKAICTFLDRENQFCLQLSGSEDEIFFDDEDDEDDEQDNDEYENDDDEEENDDGIERSEKNVIYAKFKNDDEK